jgi:hypothetical protein
MQARPTGAASDALLRLVTGPRRPATVIGAGPQATYLVVDQPDGGGAAGSAPGTELVALISTNAVRVPCAIVLASGSAALPGLVPGARARVGEGEVSWDGGSVAVVRWWRAAAVSGVTTTTAEPAELERRAALLRRLVADHELPPAVPPALRAAVASIDAGQATSTAAALRPVLGLGSGLTPSADDAAAGLLLSALAWHGEAVGPTIRAIGQLLDADLATRTTAVSAGLLQHAARGRGAPQVVRAVQHLTGRETAGDENAVLADLLALGHSSGKDTALGVLTFLQTTTNPSHRATVRESA